MARARPEFQAHGLSLHLHTIPKKWKAIRNASDARYVVIRDVNLIRQIPQLLCHLQIIPIITKRVGFQITIIQVQVLAY